jgi:cytochrome c-type biogenesis protein CcmF
MAANLGYGTLIIAFFLSIYCGLMAIWGGLRKIPEFIESARLGMRLMFLLVSLSTLCLVYLLVIGQYDVRYVYSVISNDMPIYLRLTAIWGGQSGSLLLCSWLLSLFAMISVSSYQDM